MDTNNEQKVNGKEVTNVGQINEENINDALMQQIQELRQKLMDLEAKDREESEVTATLEVAKNKRPGNPKEGRKYVRLGSLATYGKVPQQQMDIARILTENMEVGKEYTEAEVFNFLVDGCGEYNSLYTSKQDVTYLFRYYRGLNLKDGKHYGFIKRGFLRQIN